MFKKLSLKFKVIIMILPLILGLLASSIYIVMDYYHEKEQLEGLTEVADSFDDFGLLIHFLQAERGKTAMYLAQKITLNELNKHRTENVNPHLTESKRMLTTIPFPPEISKNLQEAMDAINSIRNKVDSNQISASEAFSEFSHIIQELIVGEGAATKLYSGKGIELRLISLTVVESLKESIGKTRAMYSSVFAKNTPVSLQDIGKIEAIRAGVAGASSSPTLQLVPSVYSKAQEIMNSEEWKSLTRDMDSLSTKAATGNFGVDSQKFFERITGVIENFNNVIKSERNSILEYAKDEVAKVRKKLSFIAVGLGIFLIAVGIFAILTIKELVTSLVGIVSELTSSGEVVARASHEIMETSTSLSSSVTEQASAIHQTSTSLTEISGMVESNVKGAESANALAQKIYNVTEDTQKTMEELARAMALILESNVRIEDLVRVISEIGTKTELIDDIVFKTQLLSFNASVEAERAGEHGRGFSVVAQEVGNLAQTSGTAATEISSIVKTSIKEAESVAKDNKDRVEKGGKLAEETKQKMHEVLSEVKEILEVTSRITMASKDQSTGVSQISTSVDSLNQSIQQTTTTAQHSASASEELSAQSDTLMSLVDNLKTSIYGEQNKS